LKVFEAEAEIRRKLGLPHEALTAAGFVPGDRIQIQVRPGRVLLQPMSDVIDKYLGAVPGLSAPTAQLPEPRDQ
jgi:hypothetical protein